MMLDVRRPMQASLTLVLLGNEEWLGAVYALFRPSSNVLTGRIKVVPMPGGALAIEGDLNYVPVVNCSRCWDEIAWPLQVKFKVCYRERRREALPKTLTLCKSDLDAYYHDGKSIDLAELINEQVQLALPDKTVPAAVDGRSCRHCRVDLRDTLVYGEKTPSASESAGTVV